MNPPKVCILTAGRGTRMGPGYAWLNKALLPLEDKAIISHIIDACPQGTEFVVGLGHLADQVRGYLDLAHPEEQFEFFQVDPWHGSGSGPGRSIWCCREALREPFCFIPCDFVPEGPIDTTRPGDWVGVAKVPEHRSHQYCNFRVRDDAVVGVFDKQAATGPDVFAFTGLMRIERTDEFWDAIETPAAVAGEIQISSGLDALIPGGALGYVQQDWVDVGEESLYRSEILRRHGFDFSKPGEALYIINRRVIKLFEDLPGAERRVLRGRSGPDVFPPMLAAPPGFLAYGYVEGQTLYSCIDQPLIRRLLAWCEQRLWIDSDIDRDDFINLCDTFYRTKTLGRVREYELAGGLESEPRFVMGQEVPGVRELLGAIDWALICAGGRAVRFHGDLQFDNVIVKPEGDMTLLDWRQDFAGRIDTGDIDYDLAKLLGGIRVNYARVKRGDLAYMVRATDSGDEAVITLPACDDAAGLADRVFEAALIMGRDPARIRMLTALIHLNMAPLHAEPFASALRDLARLELSAELVPA
jgi:hypothetical protein